MVIVTVSCVRKKPLRFFKEDSQGRHSIKGGNGSTLQESSAVMQALANHVEDFGFHFESSSFKKVFWASDGEQIRADIK